MGSEIPQCDVCEEWVLSPHMFLPDRVDGWSGAMCPRCYATTEDLWRHIIDVCDKERTDAEDNDSWDGRTTGEA